MLCANKLNAGNGRRGENRLDCRLGCKIRMNDGKLS